MIFLPSPGKFCKWCNQAQLDAAEKLAREALGRFNRALDAMTPLEALVRNRCGYEAKRLNPEKSERLFLKTFKEALEERPELLNVKLITENKSKVVFNKAVNQAEINEKGVNRLKALFD